MADWTELGDGWIVNDREREIGRKRGPLVLTMERADGRKGRIRFPASLAHYALVILQSQRGNGNASIPSAGYLKMDPHNMAVASNVGEIYMGPLN